MLKIIILITFCLLAGESAIVLKKLETDLKVQQSDEQRIENNENCKIW